jgi:hypothetical protein
MDLDESGTFIAHAELDIEVTKLIVGDIALAESVAALLAVLDDLNAKWDIQDRIG